MSRNEYRPAEYWTRRLEDHFDLRGTGHMSYSRAYNGWMYRAKARVLGSALDDVPALTPALDVGSGTGWVVEQLLERGALVEGCDITAVAVERLRGSFPGNEFFQCALGETPLPRRDGSYSLVTMLDVAYHITDDEQWRVALAEIARVMKPEARLIVTDTFGKGDSAPSPHVRFRSRATWATAAREAGMQLETLRPCYRWLSRERKRSALVILPGIARGAVEYALESLLPRPPHTRCATFRREP